jgi:SNF2 family DNA or RNA helicase
MTTKEKEKDTPQLTFDFTLTPTGIKNAPRKPIRHRDHTGFIKSTLPTLEVWDDTPKLKEHQIKSVNFCLKHNANAIIALYMGLGKTAVALTTINECSGFPLLIVCTASTKYHWEREVKKWLNVGKTVVILDNRKVNPDADIVIINYDVLARYMYKLSTVQFCSVIFDEAHKLKSKKAARTKAALEIAGKQYVKHRLCLTGTPVINCPFDLIPLLEIIGALDKYFDGFWGFVNRYCRPERTRWGWTFKGHDNEQELSHKLKSYCMIRFTQSDIYEQSPEKLYSIVPLDLSNRDVYLQAKNDFMQWYRESKNLNDDAELDPAVEALLKLESLKQLSVDGKIDGIIEWVTNFLEDSEDKLLLFAHHTSIVEKLGEVFNAPIISGKVSAMKRQEAIDLFQNDKKTRVIVLGIEAGGEGITLTAANHVAFVEFGWTPKSIDQPIARSDRIGQQKNEIHVYFFVGIDPATKHANKG